jgi:branched-chain amino acid transport system substrate-binding protein
MKARVSIVAAVAGAALAAAVAAGLGFGATHAAKAPLVIGIDTAKSGFQAGFDVPAVVAAQIAADEMNRSGGILGQKIKFISCDNKTDPAQTANCAVKLLSQGAHFLIESCDYDIGGPAARIAEKKGVVNFSLCAGSPKWNSIGPHSYSMTFGSYTEAAVGAQWARTGKLHCKTGYILTDTVIDYSKVVGARYAQYFTALGGKIVGQDTFKNGDSSFAAQVSRVQSTSPRPDCVFIATFPPGGATLLRELRAGGITQPVISDAGMDGDYWLSAVPRLSNFYISAFSDVFGDDPNPAINKLVRNIKARGQKTITGTAVSGYAIMQTLKIVSQQAHSIESAAITPKLQHFNQNLIIGRTIFTPTVRQSLGRPMRVMQVQNGKFSFVTLFKPKGVHL